MNESLMLVALFFISIGFVILYFSVLCVLFLLCVDACNRGNYEFVIAFAACLFMWFGFGVFVIGSVI
jgi:hypothetical protein